MDRVSRGGSGLGLNGFLLAGRLFVFMVELGTAKENYAYEIVAY